MKTKIIKLKNGKYARVYIRSTHSSRIEAEWVDSALKIVSSLEKRNVYRRLRYSTKKADEWKLKLQTLAISWNKRTVSRITPELLDIHGFIHEKNSETWYASCRTMHSQFLKRIARLGDYNGQWKLWATNTASNNRKREREKSKRKQSTEARRVSRV